MKYLMLKIHLGIIYLILMIFFFHLSTNKNIEMLRIRIFYNMKIINTSFYAN